ncbi:hypothetical protein CBL_07896 [Carabus blaptoides fortunei]
MREHKIAHYGVFPPNTCAQTDAIEKVTNRKKLPPSPATPANTICTSNNDPVTVLFHTNVTHAGFMHQNSQSETSKGDEAKYPGCKCMWEWTSISPHRRWAEGSKRRAR